jgi:putative phosphoesterase
MKLAILSDVHANIFALDAVYADLNSIGVEHILVAGDLIGYYYWPNEIVERLSRDPRVRCIRGNHEDLLEACIADDAEAAHCRVKYGSGYDCCIEDMDPQELAWLAALPASIEFEAEGVTFHVCHGALGSTDTYIYPDTPTNILVDNFSDCHFTVFGHTHYPFVHHHEGRIMLNPGSVGQPRDRGGTASYAIINLDNREVQPRRVAFDVAPVMAAARARDPKLEYLWKIMQR